MFRLLQIIPLKEDEEANQNSPEGRVCWGESGNLGSISFTGSSCLLSSLRELRTRGSLVLVPQEPKI